MTLLILDSLAGDKTSIYFYEKLHVSFKRSATSTQLNLIELIRIADVQRPAETTIV
jgi:hypothetical protein